MTNYEESKKLYENVFIKGKVASINNMYQQNKDIEEAYENKSKSDDDLDYALKCMKYGNEKQDFKSYRISQLKKCLKELKTISDKNDFDKKVEQFKELIEKTYYLWCFIKVDKFINMKSGKTVLKMIEEDKNIINLMLNEFAIGKYEEVQDTYKKIRKGE